MKDIYVKGCTCKKKNTLGCDTFRDQGRKKSFMYPTPRPQMKKANWLFLATRSAEISEL